MHNRPYTTAILAMTADGKIADYQSSAARFGSINDRLHLQKQVSLADGILFGANTLRAYGTTMSVSDKELLEARKKRSQPPQPIQIVVSASANLDCNWRFFQQPVPRWLLTLSDGGKLWQSKTEFERILISDSSQNSQINWQSTFKELEALALKKLAVLGGGELVASLLALDLIDELWLTVCPVIFGGKTAPTPVGGIGFTQLQSPKLELLEVKRVEQEVFLHYKIIHHCQSSNET